MTKLPGKHLCLFLLLAVMAIPVSVGWCREEPRETSIIPKIIDNWVETVIPRYDGLEAKKAPDFQNITPHTMFLASQYSKYNWNLYICNDRVLVDETGSKEWEEENLVLKMSRKFKKFLRTLDNQIYRLLRGKIHVLRVGNGYLIGIDRGEWGGDLWWLSKDSSEKQHIVSAQIIDILEWNGRVYILYGFRKGKNSSLTGGLLEIYLDTKGVWKERPSIKFKECPSAFCKFGSDLFVVTIGRYVIKVNRNQEVSYRVKSGFWLGLDPKSIVIDSGQIYIGMRGGVAKISMNEDNDMKWLVPNKGYIELEINNLRNNIP